VSRVSVKILFSNETRNKESKPGLDNLYSIGSVDIIGGVVYSQLAAASVLRHGIAIGEGKGRLNFGVLVSLGKVVTVEIF
jgi:hypothetical protein